MGWLLAVIAALVALVVAGLFYMTAMPARSYRGPLPPLTDEAKALAQRLQRHVEELARRERNTDLETAARYVEGAFAGRGAKVDSQYFESRGRRVRNVVASFAENASIVVGAHYDSVPGSPGADDNASAVAVLIELAALLASEPGIRFIAFANEEMPYFMTEEMGSWSAAKLARLRGEPVRAMFSLEMLGYYRDAPGSQRYPAPLGWFYPDRGDFIAFVADLGARPLLRHAVSLFRKNAQFPSEGVAAPSFIPGVAWSDHWSFRKHGFPAIMVTDTAFYRYQHYHLPTDTPEKLDYERMARVTLGLAAMLRELAPQRRQ